MTAFYKYSSLSFKRTSKLSEGREKTEKKSGMGGLCGWVWQQVQLINFEGTILGEEKYTGGVESRGSSVWEAGSQFRSSLREHAHAQLDH